MLCCAGAVAASLLPLSSAKPLGVDSAGADASESESYSTSSTEGLASQEDTLASEAARCAVFLAPSTLGVDTDMLCSGHLATRVFLSVIASVACSLDTTMFLRSVPYTVFLASVPQTVHLRCGHI